MKEYEILKTEIMAARETSSGLEAEILDIAVWLLSFIPLRSNVDIASREIRISLADVKDKLRWLRDIARKANENNRSANGV